MPIPERPVLVALLLLSAPMSAACGGDSEGSGDGESTGARPGSGGSPGSGGDSAGGASAAGAVFGDPFSGQYHLGPVDWEEGAWHNACAPYPASVQTAEGQLLAGLSTQHMDGGRLCDACVLIQEEGGGEVVARVVTYGDTGPNDIDLSPAACAALSGDAGCDVWPRNMSWQLTRCPESGGIVYQFQTEANPWWTSFWVRNARVPLSSVEVRSANHPEFVPLAWGGDGTLTDAGGFGDGEFSLRVTAVDGQQITDTFPAFTPGGLLASSGQFE